MANLYHVLGMNGHGITIHAAIAMSVCELMLRRGTELDVSEELNLLYGLDLFVSTSVASSAMTSPRGGSDNGTANRTARS